MLPAITVTQQFSLTISPKTAPPASRPAPVDGVPTWASSNEAAAVVVPNPGGMSAIVKGQGVGDYSVSVSADADMGAGVRTLVEQDSGTVTIGEAASLGGFTVGAVEEQP